MRERVDIEWSWAGVTFLVLDPHRVSMFRQPGLVALVKRYSADRRSILFVDCPENISTLYGAPEWSQALTLGFDELHVCLLAEERIDRLIFKDRIIKREEPILNLLQSMQAGSDSMGREHVA